MLAVALIVLRETLEAALIVGIVLAASVGIPGRIRWISGGGICGVGGAVLVAMFAAGIENAFAGNGQELLNAAIFGLAVCMIAWHNIWMASYGSDLAHEANTTGRSVATGGRPMVALSLITGAAVLREGSETVLFLTGLAVSSSETPGALLMGGIIGLIGGVVLGGALYLGLLRIPVRRLFSVMSVLMLFLAAGLAAQGVSFLAQADLLPSFGDGLWDTSSVLTEESIPGKILHTLFGYVARPSGIQAIAWVATVIGIATPMWLVAKRRNVATLAAVVAGAVGLGQAAKVEVTVCQPPGEQRAVELDRRGPIMSGPDGSLTARVWNGTHEVVYSISPA